VRLLVKLLGDYLNEVAYPAELAGLSYAITNHLAGFQVRGVPLLQHLFAGLVACLLACWCAHMRLAQLLHDQL
jgi:secreted Zn-dependent insulinase-like peptidase